MATMTGRRRRGARSMALGLAAAAVGLVACGNDDGENSDAYAAAGPNKESFCLAMAKVDEPLVKAGQHASPEQKVEAAKKVADRLNDTAKAAPPDIAAAAHTKLEAIRTAAQGNPSGLVDSTTLRAAEQVKTYCRA